MLSALLTHLESDTFRRNLLFFILRLAAARSRMRLLLALSREKRFCYANEL